MKRKLKEKRSIFTILLVLWLFFVFFVGSSFNPDTGKRDFTLTTNWLQHFRKGLDVSGWTKLVFKLSYDKYEQVYEWAELASVKKMIEKIILKNIDNRISSLWVSDYKAYVQNMDNQPYIIVEIGWVADLDQAKEIIWKTVELEFRLPNDVEPSADQKQERKNLAYSLRDDVLQSNWEIEKFADARWSENIFYNHFTWVTISQLPKIFVDNIGLLSVKTWNISDIITDTFDILNYQDYSWNQKSEELYGYTFYRVNSIETLSRNNISLEDVVDISNQLWYSYEQEVKKSEWWQIDTYDFVDWDLVYNIWNVAPGTEAYDIKIVQINSNSLLWMSEEEIANANQEKEKILENVEKNIKNSDSFDGAELVVDGWIEKAKIDNILTTFDSSKVWEISVYSELSSDYVVYLREVKNANDDLFSTLVVKNVNKNKFEDAMKSKILYDVETVFVQDRETWKTAKSTNWDILNWAYFKYANTSQSQVWLPVVVINFDDKGKEVFCEITSENIWNQMAIFVWWEMLTSPTIRSKICGWTAQIDGQFDMNSARELVDSLNDWALPAPLVLMQEEKIAPTLWANAFRWALIAALVGILAISVFMFMSYWLKKAVITLMVLSSFMIILAFVIKVIDYALSLSGIAAVILSIWMAVDANILIYERKKEEELDWKSQLSSINIAYDRSWPAIRDWNISTGLIALLLFMLGSNMFKWFGFMLMVTVAITLLVNVPMIKMLLKYMYKK